MNTDCKHISKRKSKNYQTKGGSPLYKCTLEATIIGCQFDPDGDLNLDNDTKCNGYEKKSNT
ncbi:hypothetical protein [Clostridium beijerinckii]|uniref:hypothetical protein n=1 Tax=Clostridium beijerinckii TaxID=1520 RepID=UPI0014945089|nr:hypothetical protein [Clostridium beijerinckii]NOW07835.1 hypothetical protein [Clostridium beijerinckii]NYC05466.1 hypothetical protein [Clostridium beijerinckii]